MKNKKRIIIVLLLLLLTTGCTKQLTDSNNKPVKNETTGQTLTENIICKPTNKETYNIYKENKIKVDKLPDCEEFKITDGKYESLWNSFIVKPMAFLIIFLGKFVKNYGLSVIIISLLIRLIAYPVTKKFSSPHRTLPPAICAISAIVNLFIIVPFCKIILLLYRQSE